MKNFVSQVKEMVGKIKEYFKEEKFIVVEKEEKPTPPAKKAKLVKKPNLPKKNS